ncbi:MAG: group II truncated hemoglobin [Pseudomonadota bacterium]
MNTINNNNYGVDNSSFIAAGKETGINKLVKDFYNRMASDSRFSTIYNMHPDNIESSIDKLARFLCGWLGGPKRYQEKYGSISIPAVHQHLTIKEVERDEWLTCMQESIDEQPYNSEFKEYLIKQLSIPAEVIRKRCNQ